MAEARRASSRDRELFSYETRNSRAACLLVGKSKVASSAPEVRAMSYSASPLRSIRAFAVSVVLLGFSAIGSAQEPVIFDNNFYSTNPQKSVVGDVNKDGAVDIVSITSDAKLNVLLNDGDGRFNGPGAVFATGQMDSCDVALGDFDGDGNLDAIVPSCGSASFAVMKGNGAGGFTAAGNVTTPVVLSGVASGDLNGDNKPDVAFTTGSGSSVLVYFGKGDGSFTGPSSVAYVGQFSDSPAIGDINGDGKLDLAFLTCCSSDRPTSTVQVLNTTPVGSTTFSGTRSVIEVGTAKKLILADVDKDGRADILTAFMRSPLCDTPCNANGASWYFSNADGTKTKGGYVFNSPGLNFFTPGGIAVGDFNADGLNDIALSVNGRYEGNEDQVRYFLATSGRKFAPVQPSGLGGRRGLVWLLSADLNNDRRWDLITVNENDDSTDVKLAKSATSYGVEGSLYCEPVATAQWNFCAPRPGRVFSANGPIPIYVQATVTPLTGQTISSTSLFIDNNLLDTSNNASMIAIRELGPGQHLIRLRALTNTGAVIEDSYKIEIGTGGTSLCAAPGTPGALFCSPLGSTSVGSPVYFSARATAQADERITAMKLYVDGVERASSINSWITASLSLSQGTHRATVRAWTNAGKYFAETIQFNVTATGTSCIPATAGTLQLCSPLMGGSYGSPVPVVAGARAATGTNIASMKIYVDGVARQTIYNAPNTATQQISTSIGMADGSRRVTVKAFHADGREALSQTVYIAVGPDMPE